MILGYLVFIAAFASLLSAFIYIRSMLKGHAKPNRITWFMWSIAPFIATAAALSDGVGWAVIPVFMSGAMPFLIFTASFFTKKAYWKLSSFDYLCGTLSGIAIILWLVTKNPEIAIAFAIISDAFAAIPTFKKAWTNPETESAWPFIIGVFNALTSFTVITMFTFPETAFPIYLIAVNILLSFAVYHRKLRNKPFHRVKQQKNSSKIPGEAYLAEQTFQVKNNLFETGYMMNGTIATNTTRITQATVVARVTT